MTVLAYEVLGEGPAVLLLHAGVADRRMWAGVAAPLAERRRVVTADLPGFGDTPVPAGPFSFADLLYELIDELDALPADVVACSFSGMIAVQLAVADRDAITSLVLISPASDAHDWSQQIRDFGDREEQLLESGDIDGATELNVRMWATEETAGGVRLMQRRAFELQADAEGLQPSAESLWPDPPAFTRLAEIAVPTLVVTGTDDHADFVAIADTVAADIPGAQRMVVPQRGHLLAMEDPEQTVRIVAGFLDEHRPVEI